jgi:hypothetical protein
VSGTRGNVAGSCRPVNDPTGHGRDLHGARQPADRCLREFPPKPVEPRNYPAKHNSYGLAQSPCPLLGDAGLKQPPIEVTVLQSGVMNSAKCIQPGARLSKRLSVAMINEDVSELGIE